MTETAQKDTIPFSERLTGELLFLPVRLTRVLPYRWRVPVAGWFTSRILAPLAGYSQRVRDNLALVCPELSRQEVERITRGVTDNAGRNMVELYSPEFAPRVRERMPITGPGVKVLQDARDAGRPGIIISAHIGSFNAARTGIAAQGIQSASFYRPMSNRPFNAHYAEAMERISQPVIEQSRQGLVQMVRHLRKGGVVSIMNDLNTHDGLPLEFFGHPALTSLSAAELALKYDAPLVPLWALREPNGLDFRMTFEAPIPHSDPLTMTREFNRRLEVVVRANMEQWFWIHRRWKDGANAVGEMRAKELEALERKLAEDPGTPVS
ncbi:MAG: lysophospholipid acyltransferase family protein [Roseovarius sp.]|uniref:lysophospholipid acyltransferase family protein n=1 Tax=Roseovarius sp. TaxID=1486281 RepID=UPI0032EB8131